MSDPIHIRYTWNRQNVEKLFDSSYTYVFRHSVRRYIGWFFIALLQFGVVATLKQGSIGMLMFSSIMLLYWYYVRKRLAHRRTMASFEASAFKDQTIEITADEEGLEIRSDGGGEQVSWEEIDGIVGLDDAILLYKDPHTYYIPVSGFASIDAKSRFKTLAKQHGKLRA
jgi:hypothetical protein